MSPISGMPSAAHVASIAVPHPGIPRLSVRSAVLLGTTRHRRLVAPTLLGLIAAPLAVLATSAPAHAAGPGLVINEVYGGGGGGVATFENDFVELRNTTAQPITLIGKSLQYRGPNSTVLPLAENVVALPDVVVPAGETFLVKGASASGNPNPPGEPLPEPDMTTTLNLGGIDGQIFLADTTSPTNPNVENGTPGNTFDANVLDFVGYGPSTSFEGAGPTPTPTGADSVSRTGGVDTDVNGTDLTVSSPPTPRCTGCGQASLVSATSEPATYGQGWTAEISVEPTTATGAVEIFSGATLVGTGALADGSAEVPISGTVLPAGSHTLDVRYLGDETHDPSEGSLGIEVVKAASSTALTVGPAVVVGQGRTIIATVEGNGFTPTGEVEFKVDGVTVGSATLAAGVATFSGGPFNAVGTFDVTASYLGDANTEASESDAAELQVVKAAAVLSVTTAPGKVVVDRTRAKVTTAIRAGGQAATGRIEVKVGTKTYKATLTNGRATVVLKSFPTTGKKQVKVTYLGNATTQRAVKTVTIKVVRKR